MSVVIGIIIKLTLILAWITCRASFIPAWQLGRDRAGTQAVLTTQCWGLMSMWELSPARVGTVMGGTGLGTKAMNP